MHRLELESSNVGWLNCNYCCNICRILQLFMMLAGQVLAVREALNEDETSPTRRKSSSSSMKIRPNPRLSDGKKSCC